jgi:hypothetical protein
MTQGNWTQWLQAQLTDYPIVTRAMPVSWQVKHGLSWLILIDLPAQSTKFFNVLSSAIMWVRKETSNVYEK